MARLEEQITTGQFNYREFFPGSKNAAKFDPAPAISEDLSSITQQVRTVPNNTPLFKDFAEVWFNEKSVEWRNSTLSDCPAII